MSKILTHMEIEEVWVEHGLDECGIHRFTRAIEAAILSKLNSAEPVCYEYRTWYGENTVTPGWSEWVRVTPRNALCTMEDAVNEIDHYIGAGYKYQLRELYEHPPAPSVVDAFPQAHRLALELECLLLDCKDNVAVSRWWDSANEALDQWREFCTTDAQLAAARSEK